MITLDIYFNKLVGNGITITPKQPFSNSRMLVANFAYLAQAMNEWQQAAKMAGGYKLLEKVALFTLFQAA